MFATEIKEANAVLIDAVKMYTIDKAVLKEKIKSLMIETFEHMNHYDIGYNDALKQLSKELGLDK